MHRALFRLERAISSASASVRHGGLHRSHTVTIADWTASSASWCGTLRHDLIMLTHLLTTSSHALSDSAFARNSCAIAVTPYFSNWNQSNLGSPASLAPDRSTGKVYQITQVMAPYLPTQKPNKSSFADNLSDWSEKRPPTSPSQVGGEIQPHPTLETDECPKVQAGLSFFLC